jgi:ribose/xylose/arabinose/galactoside ABC-type transport system permease subunit
MQSPPRYQWHGRRRVEVAMTAIARALSRVVTTINDNEILKQLALLCAAALFVALLMLTYGVDLSPGFF